MASKHIHVIGVSAGLVVGWCRLTVPRASIFGQEPPAIADRDQGVHGGPPLVAALLLARYVRETQSLDYKVGPAVVIGSREGDPSDLSQVRLYAQLELAQHLDLLGDATINLQVGASVPDERLRALGLYVAESEQINDAARYALTALRQARQTPAYARELWPYGH